MKQSLRGRSFGGNKSRRLENLIEDVFANARVFQVTGVRALEVKDWDSNNCKGVGVRGWGEAEVKKGAEIQQYTLRGATLDYKPIF